MQGYQFIALTLSVAVLAGCQTDRPVTAPVTLTAPESTVQGTVVGDDRTAMEAAVDNSASGSTPPPTAEAPAGGVELNCGNGRSDCATVAVSGKPA